MPPTTLSINTRTGSTLQPSRAKQQSMKRKKFWMILTVVGAPLVAAGAFTYYRYRRDLGAAEARVSSGSTLIRTACGPIEYADVGVGAPVLIIHGAGGGFDQGLDVARPFIDHGFRVIAPSRFGYLRTPMPADASPMAQADAFACLLDRLQVGKVLVYGVSAGGPSAMQLCLRHPERCAALILGVPLAYSDQSAGARPAQRSALTEFVVNATISSDFAFWTMSKLARGMTIRTVLGTPLEEVEKATPDEQARIAQMLDLIQPISRRKNGLRNEAAVAQSLGRYDLERLTVPTLVFSVENDGYKTYAGAKYTAEHINGSRFVGYPTGGHLLVGHQREVWSEIMEFLKNAGCFHEPETSLYTNAAG